MKLPNQRKLKKKEWKRLKKAYNTVGIALRKPIYISPLVPEKEERENRQKIL